MNINFNIFTDTATIVIFDLQSLKHRITDTANWWSIEEDEIDEINNGNAVFLNLGSDGEYLINIVESLNDYDDVAYINVPSGNIFIGAGEDTTGGDLEPDDINSVSGYFIKLPPENYAVRFKRVDSNIYISFALSKESKNNIKKSFRL
ncbi:DUF6386 family protein [Pectobacterium parmentieri]|uniref:DUF6386 family protein n=1 Tax=Pectobacterium parmentieri TaxID=1905730 RepID=UPI0018E00912|nr:DUF6386 family protein [Pectobacterium parmentieri]MBI0552028.1 hypothetical protein [Pectobacterium parmentieri]MBI0561113.1 hypothetical protein [Pectobacterium parmentieri]MBI0565290.1 hypothetical protein [Pectobacterium parmentieri]